MKFGIITTGTRGDIRFNKISTKKIISAIEQAQTPLMIESAKKFGDIVTNEDGVNDAVDLIEAYFMTH